jgi:hypothetical protein
MNWIRSDFLIVIGVGLVIVVILLIYTAFDLFWKRK